MFLVYIVSRLPYLKHEEYVLLIHLLVLDTGSSKVWNVNPEKQFHSTLYHLEKLSRHYLKWIACKNYGTSELHSKCKQQIAKYIYMYKQKCHRN